MGQQQFSIEPSDVEVTPGHNTSLTCLVNNLAGECRWQKDGKVSNSTPPLHPISPPHLPPPHCDPRAKKWGSRTNFHTQDPCPTIILSSPVSRKSGNPKKELTKNQANTPLSGDMAALYHKDKLKEQVPKDRVDMKSENTILVNVD